MKYELTLFRNRQNPEITTTMLMGLLSGYSDARKKINSMVKQGYLKPIKQGVYLIAEDYQLLPYSKELLANLIYGPSYISLETALSNYGFIPERVSITTSICFNRGRFFSTLVGDFEYHHLKDTIYAPGVQLKEVHKDTFCQYATPEKALLDFIYLRDKKGVFKRADEYFEYIMDSYRFDLEMITKVVSPKKLQQLANLYPFMKISWFANELTRKLLQ